MIFKVRLGHDSRRHSSKTTVNMIGYVEIRHDSRRTTIYWQIFVTVVVNYHMGNVCVNVDP